MHSKVIQRDFAKPTPRPANPGSPESSDWPGKDLRYLLALLAASLLLFFLGLSTWGFIDPGDGYFSETAREMIERNDYIVPHLNYQIYFSKPILIYWLIISAYKLFGINEFAARFWSAAFATLMVLGIYWTTRSIVSRRAGLLSALAFGSAPLVVTFARMSLIDMSFSCLLGLSLCATSMTLFTDSKRWCPLIYVCLGLAVLDKGPAGLVLYLIGVTGFAISHSRQRCEIKATLQRLNLPLGILIFTAIAVPWYIAVGLATNWLWPQVFFFFENIGRFAGHTNHRNPAPLFYLPVLCYGFFPWVLFLPCALFAAVRDKVSSRRTERKVEAAADQAPKAQSQPQPQPHKEQQQYTWLAASWALAVLAFFSLSLTKLQTYILPAFPAMAILTGIMLDKVVTAAQSRTQTSIQEWTIRTATIVLSIIGTLAAAGALVAAVASISPDLVLSMHAARAAQWHAVICDTPAFTRIGLIGMVSLIATGFLRTSWLWRNFPGDDADTVAGITTLAVTCVLSCAIGAPLAFQLGYKYKDANVHAVAAALEGRPGPVAIYHDFKPALVFHVRRPVDTFFSTDQLHARTAGDPPVQYIITGSKGADELFSSYPTKLHTVARQGSWYLLETHELTAVRLPTLERSFKEHIDLSGGEYSWGTLPFAGGTKP